MKRIWCWLLAVTLIVGMTGPAAWGLEDEASPDVYMEYSYYSRPQVEDPGYSVSVINAEYEFYLAFFQEDGRLVEGSPLYHLTDYWSDARVFDTGDGYTLFYRSVLDTLDYVFIEKESLTVRWRASLQIAAEQPYYIYWRGNRVFYIMGYCGNRFIMQEYEIGVAEDFSGKQGFQIGEEPMIGNVAGFTRYRQGSVDYIEVFLQDEDAKYIGSLEVFPKDGTILRQRWTEDEEGFYWDQDYIQEWNEALLRLYPDSYQHLFLSGPFLDIYGKQLYLWEGPEYYLGDRLEYYDLSLDETQGELPMAKYAPVSEMRFVQGKLLFEDSNVAAILHRDTGGMALASPSEEDTMTSEDFEGTQAALGELPYAITIMSRSGEVLAAISQESFPLMWQGTAEILLSPALDGQFFRGDDAQYLLIRNEEEVYGEDVTFFYNITDHVMIYDSGKSAEELEGAISSRQLEEAEEIVTSAGSSPSEDILSNWNAQEEWENDMWLVSVAVIAGIVIFVLVLILVLFLLTRNRAASTLKRRFDHEETAAASATVTRVLKQYGYDDEQFSSYSDILVTFQDMKNRRYQAMIRKAPIGNTSGYQVGDYILIEYLVKNPTIARSRW